MKRLVAFNTCFVLLACVVWCTSVSAQFPTNDDPSNQIRFNTTSEAKEKRSRLIAFIWKEGFPETTPSVTKDVPLPHRSIGIDPTNVARVDRLDSNVSNWDFHSISYLFHPKNTANANRVVIVHHGHARNLELGIGSTANHLLRNGFSVVVMNLPLYGWNSDSTAEIPDRGTLTYKNHNAMIFDTSIDNDGQGFRLFLEPVVQNINYLMTAIPDLRYISMIGLSGGGWATSMMAAIDPRIKLSIPIAGSCPLYQRNADPQSIGDAEQVFLPLYDENIRPDGSGGGVATWLEIYVLGSYGAGRRQIQISNEFDSCCFAGNFADSYAPIVRRKISQLGTGHWIHVLDSTHKAHQISNHVIATVINPALKITEPEPVPSGLPIRDDFDDQTDEIPNGWSLDPHYGSGSGAVETAGFVSIRGAQRAALVRNVPFNPQRQQPIEIFIKVARIPPQSIVGVYLTDEVDSVPQRLALQFDDSTKQIMIDADDGRGFDVDSDRLILGKVPCYDGEDIAMSLRFDARRFSAEFNAGKANEFLSSHHSWSDIPNGFDVAKLGDRTYVVVQVSDAEGRPIEGVKVDSVEVTSVLAGNKVGGVNLEVSESSGYRVVP